MTKLKLIYEVPSALGLTALSSIAGFFAIKAFLSPEVPGFFMTAPIAAGISFITGVGAANLWKQVGEDLKEENR